MRRFSQLVWCPLLGAALSACAAQTARSPVAVKSAVEVQILAINDFHGNLEPPHLAIAASTQNGQIVQVPAGGAAHLVTAARSLRQGQAHTMTVSAGDMVGASPIASALFLDEPTIAAMELAGIGYNAIGNHEFDRGLNELLRLQQGGCAKHTARQPCALERYDGASFTFLSANVRRRDGSSPFTAAALKDFGPVQVGVIGITLKEAATLVSPSGVAGLTFADEAASANALVPKLKQDGADAIVLLIHQGGHTTGGFDDKTCPGLSGDILSIIARLDPRIDVVVSGHTHAAYVCEVPRTDAAPLLLTSAGRYGTLITDIRLSFGRNGRLRSQRADNRIVQGEPYQTGSTSVPLIPAYPRYPADASTAALVDRYVRAAAPVAAKVVGRLAGAATRAENEHGEQTAGYLVADAALAAGRPHFAEIAFVNSGGVRTDLIPAADGTVTFGQIFAMQPFGNNLVLLRLTGAQLKEALEQQFRGHSDRPKWLLPSRGFAFEYDRRRSPGDRIRQMTLAGVPIVASKEYRIVVPNFLASGGDGFNALKAGQVAADAGFDVDALSAWLRPGAEVPQLGRMTNRASELLRAPS